MQLEECHSLHWISSSNADQDFVNCDPSNSVSSKSPLHHSSDCRRSYSEAALLEDEIANRIIAQYVQNH